MRWLAAFVDRTRLFGQTRARSLVAEFARWTDEELDYRIEARHAAVLRRNADSDPLERNPRVYPTHTSARVLTVEYLDGIPVIDIITAIRRRDAAFLERLAERGHDARRIASHIVWNALNQIYRFASREPSRPSRRCDRVRRLRDRGQARRSDHRGAALLRAEPLRGTHRDCRR
jgi:predicted unusual protein kinase regulating ubiquinone biosynthesis (AarF/ABC1/UbiB family)